MTHPTPHRMTCTAGLGAVATADVLELTTATAITEHCRGCPDCAGVIEEVAREERRLADTLDGVTPGVPAQVVALRAVAAAARGRRGTRRLRIGLGALAAVVAPLLLLRDDGVAAAGVETRNVELQCLAPSHAAVLVRPALPRDVARGIRIEVAPHGLPVIEVSGTPRDLATAEQLIAQIDSRWGAERSEYCALAPRAGAAAAAAGAAAPGQPVQTTIVTPPAPAVPR